MKKREKRSRQDKKSAKQESRASKQELKGSKRQANTQPQTGTQTATVRSRPKRSGVEAVKLHLEATGHTGRSSRSATAVRKTSIRMTAIKEYPFDLSDLKNQPPDGSETKSAPTQPSTIPAPTQPSTIPAPPQPSTIPAPPQPSTIPAPTQLPSRSPSSASTDGKRKVSIMADESSKDRENLPSDRRRIGPQAHYIRKEHTTAKSVPAAGDDREIINNPSRPLPEPARDAEPVPSLKLPKSRNGRISAQAEGPSRRKSNLHNAMASEMDSSWDRQGHIEGRFKKYSTTSSVYSKKALSQQSEHIERSWWYACCAKCHQEDSGIPSWEPPNWQKICPYPLCPSYRQFAQTLSVLLIGVIVWVLIWIVMGETAAPGGQLFNLAALTIAAYFGGWLMQKITTLPGLIGMLIVGIVLKNVGFVNFDETYLKVASYIRKIALTIILTRAGLDLDPMAMKKYFLTVIKLALVPWTFEFVLCAVLSYFFLGLPWSWAFLLGSIVAAVSPAVIVPCLFRLRNKGYGVSKGIPTLVLAVSGIDDAASVAIFGIVCSIMFSSSSLVMNVIQGPLSIFGGIAFGILCGYLVKFVPERNDAFLVPLRVLLLFTGGLVSVLGSEEIGWGGAGPLAVIAFAFFACKNWVDLGWELEDNPVATAFEIFWMFFEPMLFAVTGAQVVIADLAPHMVLVGGGILLACMVLRAMVTSVSAVRSNLNMREKIFVGLAWMAKATVQAALAPVALDEVRKMAGDSAPDPLLLEYGETIITICILSIALTAPLGAIVITITGPRLLSKTTKPPVLEGWRRSHRPSIRDISIIDEEDLAERDAEVDTHSPPPLESPEVPAAYSTPNAITVQPNHRQ